MITRELRFSVPGEPKGKGRPRFMRGTGLAYTPKQTQIYENLVAMSFRESFPDWIPTEEPISMTFDAYFSIPKSWSKKKRQMAIEGRIRPTKKPDSDNIAKVKDALNEIAWKDDAQVIHEEVSKYYSDNPRLEICIELWRPD